MASFHKHVAKRAYTDATPARNAPHTKVVLITAPAGSGKSTLIRRVFFNGDATWPLYKHIYTNPKSDKQTFTLYHQNNNKIIMGAYKFPDASEWGKKNRGKTPTNGGTDKLQPQSTLATRDLIMNTSAHVIVLESSTGKILNKIPSLFVPIMTSSRHELVVIELTGPTREELLTRIETRDGLNRDNAMTLLEKTIGAIDKCKQKLAASRQPFHWYTMTLQQAESYLQTCGVQKN